jgi:hypothetical protein
MDGHEVGNTMGVNTWEAFAGSNEQAMVDGDFAMLESALQHGVGVATHFVPPLLGDWRHAPAS